MGGTQSEAWAVNASGQAVGWSYLAGDAVFHAFRTSSTGTLGDPGTDLGTLGGTFSFGFGINGLGQAVGYAATAGNATSAAFLADLSGPMQNLNDLIPGDSGWVLGEARGINDAGQIVGVGTVGGLSHAFLLTPAAPEPGILGMTLFAAVAMLSRRRRKL